MDAAGTQWGRNMSVRIYAITPHEMRVGLTFVVSAVHFNHHIVQLLLL